MKYVFDYVFKNYLQVDFQLCTNLNDASKEDVLMTYGEPLKSSVYFGAHGLLSENNIVQPAIDCSEYNNHTVFFQISDQNSILPYDAFALIFYMLSRYEEYLPFTPDEHGRFPSEASIAFKNDFLEQPVVEYAINDIVKAIKKQYPDFDIKERKFEIELSYDVDAPFAYRGKGFFKNLGGGLQMLLSGKILQGLNRLGFALAGGKDPFNNFYEILSQLEDYQLEAMFFLLLEEKGKHNPSVNYKFYAFDILAEKLARYHKIGIHPSYDCNNLEKLEGEIARYRELLNDAPIRSRHHFLQIKTPESYRLLAQAGIKHDYSMAFPDRPGFRAGCSRPFPFYDLEKEEKTDLIIHPFCLMDATFEYYLDAFSAREIIEKYKIMAKEIYQLKGTLHMLFHNDILSGYESKHNWKAIKEQILQFLKEELFVLSK